MGLSDTMDAITSFFRRGSGYTPVPADDASSAPRDGVSRDQNWRALKLTAAALMLVTLGYLAVAFLQSVPRKCDTPDRGFQCEPTISHFWGQYSPYYSVPSEIDASIPEGCELTFVQVLSRHGARDPTLGKSLAYADLIRRIHDAVTEFGPGYEFIKAYQYTLGADQLTAMGQQQMVNSGLAFYHRYRSLASKSLPFVRAAGMDRVVHSAQNWTRGFHDALVRDGTATAPRHPFPYDMVVIPETHGVNNTLHHGLCPAFEDSTTRGRDAQAIFAATFTPRITARLNAHLPGANLSDADTIALMDLCPFETVASPRGNLLSPFCGLFAPDEWQRYDYLQSLGKWYGYGPGNGPLGPTQGVGFVNELLARLTRTPVRDRTSTNATLDGDARTFPLDRALYADFSHDNDMVGILAALGVYEGVGMLDNSTRRAPEDAGGFAASWAVPFAARVYVEKMRCGDEEGEEMVRVLVNDRVVRLKGCGADELGRCSLSRFVESMGFARGGGRWDLCFA
ncbi:hypothetical protein VTK56DRAFT_7585 [Thermocarpiscus australiensis]